MLYIKVENFHWYCRGLLLIFKFSTFKIRFDAYIMCEITRKTNSNAKCHSNAHSNKLLSPNLMFVMCILIVIAPFECLYSLLLVRPNQTKPNHIIIMSDREIVVLLPHIHIIIIINTHWPKMELLSAWHRSEYSD